MLKAVGLVMLGGAAGAAIRYLVTNFSSEMSNHHGFPYGTLAVNVLGSLLVGYFLAGPHDPSQDAWRLLAATGFCGGFTTFSAYAWESVAYLDEGKMVALFANLLLNNVLAIGAVIVGVKLHHHP